MNEVDFYKDFIAKEEERLKRQRAENVEDIAAEMAGRGFIGGKQHMLGLSTMLSKEAEYLSQLRAREAELKMALLKEEIARKSAEKEAKKQRQYELLMGVTQLLTQPYKYSPTGEAKLGYEGVRDWLKQVVTKYKPIEKAKSIYGKVGDFLKQLTRIKAKPYERREFLGDIKTYQFNRMANVLRPKGYTPSLLPQGWRESLKQQVK